MSGGEQQMLAIGRALMARPKLLLLDEPSMGIAPILVERIYETIAEINQQGTTILLVEQNANYALDVSSAATCWRPARWRSTTSRQAARQPRRAEGVPGRMTVVLALIGAKALWLLYVWLASAIVASYLSARKGYGEKPAWRLRTAAAVRGRPRLAGLARPRPDSRWKLQDGRSAWRKDRRRVAGRAAGSPPED